MKISLTRGIGPKEADGSGQSQAGEVKNSSAEEIQGEGQTLSLAQGVTGRPQTVGQENSYADGRESGFTVGQEGEEDGQWVRCPLVGTFYAASSPEEEPYVKVGDTVKKGQILGIVEAMKLMNEIESEFDGTVKAIHVNNAEMVQYGQPMFLIG